MSGFLLFPEVRNGLEWITGRSDIVIQPNWNIVAAMTLLFIGKFIVHLLSRGLEKLLLKRKVDRTIIRFFTALVRYITLAFSVITTLGRIGIGASPIIAVIGTAGLAIGLVLQGSLSDFAAGVLLTSLRPFRAGEVVQIGAVTGTVEKVHIFSTTLLTADGKEVVIPNGRIITDSIVSYSRYSFRRIDLMIGVGYRSRIAEVKQVTNHIVEQDSRIDEQRGVTIRLGELGASTLSFYVRVWVPNIEYWDTYYDLLGSIRGAPDANHIDLPYPQMDVCTQNVAP